MLLWLVLWGALLCTLLYHYGIKPMKYWKDRGVKQGNPVWIFGDYLNMLLSKESFTETVIRLYNQYPNERYTGIYQFLEPTLLIRDPELLKQIAVKDFEYFVDHWAFLPGECDSLATRNLFFLKGRRWKHIRSVLTPTFTSSKIKNMFDAMNENAQIFVNHFKSKQCNDVIEVEMKDVITRYSNDVIISIAFGMRVNSLKDRHNFLYEMGKETVNISGFWKIMKIMGFVLAPKVYTLLKIGLFSSEVTNFFTNLVKESITVRKEHGIVRSDMINLLLAAKKRIEGKGFEDKGTSVGTAKHKAGSELKREDITDMDIAAQALLFFFAAFDSVSNVMAFLAYELAINPDIQKRLRSEIQESYQQCGEKFTYEAVQAMKFIEMVTAETLRKYPNVVVTDRLCTKPYTITSANKSEKPLFLEQNTVVLVPVFAFHYDSKYFPNPEKFDPERFSEENKEKINPYTYIPFGIGPRNCIGNRYSILKMKVLICNLLLNFEIVPIDKTTIPIKYFKSSLTIKSQDGHWLGLKPITGR